MEYSGYDYALSVNWGVVIFKKWDLTKLRGAHPCPGVACAVFSGSLLRNCVSTSIDQTGRMEDEIEAGAAAQNVASERAKATGDLDKVTDYVEERELDASAAADKMRAVLGAAAARRGGAAAREQNAVKIAEADVATIVAELEVDVKVAERALREARGQLVEALSALVRS